MHQIIDLRQPEQILPGLTMRVQGREGISVSYSPDGAGGVTVRVDWRHAMEFWFEFHLEPAGECLPAHVTEALNQGRGVYKP